MKAIVAMTRDRVIGQGSRIPWRLRGEQAWFKETTIGHPILMGRKTFESIGNPLPGRQNLVVTRASNFDGVEIIRDLKLFNPLSYEKEGNELFVIGGAAIYSALLSQCSFLYATIVKGDYSGDVFFPEYESRFDYAETLRETPEYDIFLFRRRENI